jgi:hypothetical protein
MSSFFSTFFKDLAMQGFIVFSIEHKDFTALHFKNPAGESKYFKNFDIQDKNLMTVKLSLRK